jgi:hypothetical protein
MSAQTSPAASEQELACFDIAGSYVHAIRIEATDGRRTGLIVSQSIEIRLEIDDSGEHPPDRLILKTTTCETTIRGWRLELIFRLICENKLAWVRPVSARYAGLASKDPFISSVTVEDREGK